MKSFTYERENTRQKYEKYEWDNVWIENANDISVKRVLYVGDSISCGIRNIATAQAKGKIFFDGFGTSKGIDNIYFKDALRLFAEQEGHRECILFNNGLHGWHLEDETEYKGHYEEMIKFIMRDFPESQIVVVLTTNVTDADRSKRVAMRNNAVLELAQVYGLPVIDLYKLSKENSDLMLDDGVHFSTNGYEVFAEEIVRVCTDLIK